MLNLLLFPVYSYHFFVAIMKCACFSAATAHARKTLKCDLGVCYDEDSGQLLDIYYPSSSSVPENKINGLLKKKS